MNTSASTSSASGDIRQRRSALVPFRYRAGSEQTENASEPQPKRRKSVIAGTANVSTPFAATAEDATSRSVPRTSHASGMEPACVPTRPRLNGTPAVSQNAHVVVPCKSPPPPAPAASPAAAPTAASVASKLKPDSEHGHAIPMNALIGIAYDLKRVEPAKVFKYVAMKPNEFIPSIFTDNLYSVLHGQVHDEFLALVKAMWTTTVQLYWDTAEHVGSDDRLATFNPAFDNHVRWSQAFIVRMGEMLKRTTISSTKDGFTDRHMAMCALGLLATDIFRVFGDFVRTDRRSHAALLRPTVSLPMSKEGERDPGLYHVFGWAAYDLMELMEGYIERNEDEITWRAVLGLLQLIAVSWDQLTAAEQAQIAGSNGKFVEINRGGLRCMKPVLFPWMDASGVAIQKQICDEKLRIQGARLVIRAKQIILADVHLRALWTSAVTSLLGAARLASVTPCVEYLRVELSTKVLNVIVGDYLKHVNAGAIAQERTTTRTFVLAKTMKGGGKAEA